MSRQKIRVPSSIISALNQLNWLTCGVFGTEVPMEMGPLKLPGSGDLTPLGYECRQTVDVRWVDGIQARLYGYCTYRAGQNFFLLIGARIRIPFGQLNPYDLWDKLDEKAGERFQRAADCYGKTSDGHAVTDYRDRMRPLIKGAFYTFWHREGVADNEKFGDREIWIAKQTGGRLEEESEAYIPECWEGKLPKHLERCVTMTNCIFLQDMCN